MSSFERPPAAPRGAGRPCGTPAPKPAQLRTYVLIAIDEWGSAAEFARPLGTVSATTRTQARAAACALYTDVLPEHLRAVAAASAPAGYLARALARDGERLLGERRRSDRALEDAA